MKNRFSRMLEISTGHVSKEGVDILTDPNNSDVSVYDKGDYGWIIFVESEIDDKLEQSLKDILQYAKDHGCQWVMLDCDGIEIDELPIYDWNK
jgi:hypothetical protein